MLGPPCSRLARFIDGHHGTVMVAMLRVCHEAHHLHYGAQGMSLFCVVVGAFCSVSFQSFVLHHLVITPISNTKEPPLK